MSNSPVPEWAQRHLQENLNARNAVVNATPIGSRRVLANTKQGAVLVRKSFFGGVNHVFLEVPRARIHFPCGKCGESVQVFGSPPQALHCESCNAGYVQAADGTITDSMGVQIRIRRAPLDTPTSTTESEPETTASTTTAPRSTNKRASTPASGDAFTYNGYTLHGRVTASGGTQYFFAKSTPKSGTPCAMPDGYEVGANSRTGLPFLRRTGATSATVTGGTTTRRATQTGTATASRKATKHATPTTDYHAQCAALTSDGAQCRNSARGTSKYCASHKGYQPPGARQLATLLDTAPASDDGNDDRLLSVRGRSTSIIPGEQCLAITAAGAQCRNTARGGSKYCPSHRSYQPPTARLVAARRDTQPRVANAPDTLPSVRRTSRKR